MNKPVLAGVALVLCGPSLAQGSMTTPPGGLSTEGRGYAYFPGAFADGRYQQVDDMHTGGKPATIKQISFRIDNRFHNWYTAMGRTWTRITLDISETSNYETMSGTWSRNITQTPTRVFANKRTWRTQTGLPQSKPDVWGGAQGQLSFPFTEPWGYTGKDAILMDYVFRGGTLANNGFWPSSSGVYYLDSEDVTTDDRWGGWPGGFGGASGACSDSAVPVFSGGAYTWASTFTHGAASPTVTLRNKVSVYHYSYFTAPLGAPVIHAVGLSGLPKGVSVGARCNPLFVDFSKPVVLVGLHTIDSRGYSGRMGWTAPWNNAFRNQSLFIQAAWTDSRTKAFSLTTAAVVTVPDGLPWPAPARYKTAYSAYPDGTGTFSPQTNGQYFPYTEYRVQ